MSIDTILLVVAALALLVAVLVLREVPLMMAVAAYSGTIVWLIWNNIGLLLPALLAGIGIAVVALFIKVKRELIDAETESGRHIASQQITSKIVNI
jgi:hypothetical protein